MDHKHSSPEVDNINDALSMAIRNGGFYDNSGIWCSIKVFPGDNRIYRGRVETLIVKDYRYLFMKKHQKSYRIPGGGMERIIPNMDQAVNECREEARINVKNIVSTGISYKEATTVPKWAKNTNGITWNGKYNEVYVAEYDSKYKGKIDSEDIDSDIASGSFYPIKDVFKLLNRYHKQALFEWLRHHASKIMDSDENEKGISQIIDTYTTESTKKSSKAYFLSDINFNGQTLEPRIPNNFFTRKSYEDKSVARICFCRSIDDCLTAIARDIENEMMYVHIPDGNYEYHICTQKEVPDTTVTHEIWTTVPTKMKCIGKIQVNDAKPNPCKFYYGDSNNVGELYRYNWEWIEKYTRDIKTKENNDIEYKPLHPSKYLAKKSVELMDGEKPLSESERIQIFESMIYWGLDSSIIRRNNPLYNYISDEWNKTFNTVVTESEQVINQGDIQFLMNYLDNTIYGVKKLFGQLDTIIQWLKSNRITNYANIKAFNKMHKDANIILNEIRIDLNRSAHISQQIERDRTIMLNYQPTIREYLAIFNDYKKLCNTMNLTMMTIERNNRQTDTSIFDLNRITEIRTASLVAGLTMTVHDCIIIISNIIL